MNSPETVAVFEARLDTASSRIDNLTTVLESPAAQTEPRRSLERPLRAVRDHSFILRQMALFGGEVLSKVSTIVAFAYLARMLEPRVFGLVELSLSVIMFFVLGVENGLGSYGARLIALDPRSISTLVPKIVLLRGIFVVPAYLFILFLSDQYGMPGIGVLAVYGFTVCLVPFFNQWVFQGLAQMHWVAAGTAVRNLLFAGFVLLVIRRGSDPRWVAGAEIFGALGLVTVSAFVLHQIMGVRLRWKGCVGASFDLFRDTWSLGASNLALTCLWYAPTLVLGRFAGTEQVAWLAAPLRVVLALNMFVSIYFFNMLPNLTREIALGLDAWRAIVRRSLKTSMWLAFLVTIAGVLGARTVVTLLYGRTYEASTLPLQIVIWMIPLGWFSGNFRYTLIASGHQRSEFVASALTGIVTPLLAIVLVLRGQSVGAAAALLGGGLVYAVLVVAAAKRCVGSFSVFSATWLSTACCAASLALGLVVSSLIGDVAGAVIGCLSYAAIAVSQKNEVAQMMRAKLRGMLRAYCG